MKISYKELCAAIKKAGCEEFVTKRDVKEVFKMLSPKAINKEKISHYFATICAIISLPLAWTVGLVLVPCALIAGLMAMLSEALLQRRW